MALKKITDLEEKTKLARNDKLLIADDDSNSITGETFRDSVGELWAESDALPTTVDTLAREITTITWTIPTGSPVMLRNNNFLLPKIPPRRSIFGIWVSSEVDGVEFARSCLVWRPVLLANFETTFPFSEDKMVDLLFTSSTVDHLNLLTFVPASATLPANSVIKVYPSIR